MLKTHPNVEKPQLNFYLHSLQNILETAMSQFDEMAPLGPVFWFFLINA